MSARVRRRRRRGELDAELARELRGADHCREVTVRHLALTHPHPGGTWACHVSESSQKVWSGIMVVTSHTATCAGPSVDILRRPVSPPCDRAGLVVVVWLVDGFTCVAGGLLTPPGLTPRTAPRWTCSSPPPQPIRRRGSAGRGRAVGRAAASAGERRGRWHEERERWPLTATSLEEAAAAAYHRSLEGEDEPSSSPADANRSLVPTPGSAALTAVGLPAAGVDFGAGRVSRLASASAQTRVARRAADSGWKGGMERARA